MIRPKFEPVINVGHILQAVTIAAGIFALLFRLSGWQVTTDAAINQLNRDIIRIDARADKYLPIMDSMRDLNSIQDERISRISDAIVEQRQGVNKLVELLGDIRTDVATIKAKANNDK